MFAMFKLLGQSVVLLSDNAMIVAYLQHQDGMVFHVLCRMANEIVLWTERHLVSLMARYIPGKTNVLAEKLSRPDPVLSMEWSLLPRVFERICRVLIIPSRPLCHPD